MSGDVGAAEGFGDLAVVCDVAAQRRYRLGCCRGVRPGPQGCSGEHRLRADLEQQRAAKLGQRRHTLGELDRLAGMAAPVGAIQFGISPQCRTGPIADQNPLRRTEFEAVGVGLELIECGVQQRRMEGMAGIEPLAADTVGRQSGNRLLQIRTGTR